MKKTLLYAATAAVALTALSACNKTEKTENKDAASTASADSFNYNAEEFADVQVLRYKVAGFEELSAKQKELLFYLYKAALSGRDIIYDQNYRHNLLVRKTNEGILNTYTGEKSGADWEAFVIYAKEVFFSNGIHHHYSSDKFAPKFSEAYLLQLLEKSDAKALPLEAGATVQQLAATLKPILFDPKVDAKRVNLDDNADHVAQSANNNYEGVTEKEVATFYKSRINANNHEDVSHGLNSKLTKENGVIVEKIWKVGGMYDKSISQIVFWLEKAVTVAENEPQKLAFTKLVEFYKTGDLKKFDEYSIAWVADTASRIDAVNGFIEVYGDALGMRAAYESVVSIKDMEATKRIAAIAKEAQWFEDNSPILPANKKKSVKGISAKVITAVVEAGDAAPSTPIGINLPNATWIREKHGSKSVSLGNIVEAYDVARSTGGVLEEFAASEAEVARIKQHGVLAGKLHTDMHEVIGHASGKINQGVGTTKETLKNYASALEEARADLVALYYLMDDKLVTMGIIPSTEVGKAEYDSYIKNGLILQLNRIELGKNLEEAHMRNRQLVAKWAYEKGKADNVIEMFDKDGKTYVKINDYAKLRVLFGNLLREIQRVTSEGDYKAGKALVEDYGVKVDQALLKQVKDRYAKLGAKPYAGFIQPKLVATMDGDKVVDVKIEYPKDFTQQMLEYGKDYGFLPTKN